MKSLSLLVGFGLTLGSALPNLYPRADGAAAPGCATGLHMIIARASTEAAGPGAIGAVATMVQKAIPGSTSESVDYPATLTDYPASEASGVAGMQKLIEAYTTKCPNGKYALMGYSQGAQVVGDVLSGTSSEGFTATPPIAADMTKNLVAVVQMGDPTSVNGQPQNVGSSTNNGVFPRKDTAAMAPYADKTAAYCNSGDEFCDSGNSLTVHLAYIMTDGTAASKFIVGKMKGAA